MAQHGLGPSAPVLGALTAVIVLFLLVPLIFPIVLSVSDTPFVVFPPQGFTLRWYQKILEEPDFTASFRFSLLLGLLAAVGALLLGTPAAFALVRFRFPGRHLVQALVLSPLIFPMLVTGIALLRFFSSIHWQDALWNLTIGHILVTVPYVIRTVSASLLVVDPNIEDAARTLGASKAVTIWRITRPQITPGLVAGGVFAISMWLSDAANVPLPLTIFTLINRMFDPGIAAISSLMIVMSLVVVLVMEKLAGLRRAMSF
jgi:putative spermidine/putrescine transport system permease protein